MLNSDALQQLAQLKQSIEDTKDYAEGVVRGTQSRFGFVTLDDGREAFLPPETMQQVLPGDRVKVSLTENDKKKHEAHLEKLLSTELKEFVGTYVEKGNNHFVSADHPQLSRWLFVPPKQRKNYRHGDLVSCRVSRHPFGDGRAQVSIKARIGRAEDAGIERQYMIHKHNLPSEWSQEALEEAKAIASGSDALAQDEREDLRHLDFVTIDAESTLDMDDALYLESAEDGWLLYTAIADPAAFVQTDSALDRAARQRASSVYFPGQTLPMFPNELSQDAFSLLAGVERPAMVCKLRVASSGEVLDYTFCNALIRSRHKLSYNQVADLLENGNETAVPGEALEILRNLHHFAGARKQYRDENHVVQEDKFDYVFRLNKQQKIEKIERRQTTLAHRVIEEAMLATNCCAGEFFARAAESLGKASGGLFSSHAGFRPERVAEIEQLLKKDKPDIEKLELEVLDSFRQLIRALQQDEADSVLLATLKRRLQPANVTYEPGPHFGLGFDYYATITSPIRRYQDLHNHRMIKALLAEQHGHALDDSLTEDLQAQIIRNRQACRQVEQWLLCQFMARRKGQVFDAVIASVASQGILVRLTDTGAEGFIPIRGSKKEPPKYDSLRMTLTHQGTTYHLEQPVRVKLDKVDLASRQLQLSLAPDEPREKKVEEPAGNTSSSEGTAEGSIKPAEGSPKPAEGSLKQAEGSPEPAEGSPKKDPVEGSAEKKTTPVDPG
ncbi:VacB/RNase II family 3'-5' exoribonuclease [Gilvimarinus sp. F26214L]|uniref:VacB/RNase II family 3'-5' exoribonuclease n=1 Tax=Gilvimarinus sp. DZF01 TaxID=3461371 RepID=UPI004045A816